MGLTAEITADIQEAYAADLADAVKSVILLKEGAGIYNPGTGENTPNISMYTTRAVCTPVDKANIDGEVIKIGDVGFLILKAELSVIPDVGDQIEATVDGVQDFYTITNIVSDPADVTWECIGRVV